VLRTDRQTDRQTDGQNCYINIARQWLMRDKNPPRGKVDPLTGFNHKYHTDGGTTVTTDEAQIRSWKG